MKMFLTFLSTFVVGMVLIYIAATASYYVWIGWTWFFYNIVDFNYRMAPVMGLVFTGITIIMAVVAFIITEDFYKEKD